MLHIRNTITLFVLISALLTGCGGTATETGPTVSEPPIATTIPVAAASSAGAEVSGQHTYVIVPEQSKASYLVNEEFFAGAFAKYGIDAGLADVVGSTQAIEGQLQLNFDNLSAALGENSFTVKMNTLVTGRDPRDGWIRENGPRFNDYPLATFKATAIEGAPTAYTTGQEVSFQLVGDLTIREITKPTTFAVKATLVSDTVGGDTLTGTATTRLKMSDFGIDPPNFANTLTVADEFGIEVTFTAKESQ